MVTIQFKFSDWENYFNFLDYLENSKIPRYKDAILYVSHPPEEEICTNIRFRGDEDCISFFLMTYDCTITDNINPSSLSDTYISYDEHH